MDEPSVVTKNALAIFPHEKATNLIKVMKSIAILPARRDQAQVWIKEYATAKASNTPTAIDMLRSNEVRCIE